MTRPSTTLCFAQGVRRVMTRPTLRFCQGAWRAVLPFVLSLSSIAWAQQTPKPAPAVAPATGESSGPKVKVERSASGQKIFRITEGIVVEGRIQKPNAFYVLQRSSMDYDWEQLKQDFLPKILQATSQSPF